MNLPIFFFVVYVTVLLVPEIIPCRIIGSEYIINLKTRKWSHLNLNYYPSICLLEGRKTTKPSETIEKLGRVTKKHIVTDLCYKQITLTYSLFSFVTMLTVAPRWHHPPSTSNFYSNFISWAARDFRKLTRE